jgi:hypothetical protein
MLKTPPKVPVRVARTVPVAFLEHSRFRIIPPEMTINLPGANHRRRMGVNGYFVKFFTSGRRGAFDSSSFSSSSSSSFRKKIEDEEEKD